MIYIYYLNVRIFVVHAHSFREKEKNPNCCSILFQENLKQATFCNIALLPV